MKNKHPVKIICSVICLLSWFIISAVSDTKPPEAEITNGLIHARLYLPDVDNGYYRASRFDWSGVISALEYKGHDYYGQWFEKYDPMINDAIMGPVEAFDPIGFDEAKPGESFVKIGVGVLKKPDTSSYNFAAFYPNTDHGKWKVKVKPDRVQFSHTLKGTAYDYEYSKTVRLIKDKPIMMIGHTLKNTGTKTITTSVFDHNFFVIDKQPTGPGFVITFPFNPAEKVNPKMEGLVKLQDNQLIFLKELNRRNASFKDLTNGNGAPYNIQVENHNTGAGVKITADQAISKLVFWSASKTVCPEPYINIKIDPGQEFSWNMIYEYYTTDLK